MDCIQIARKRNFVKSNQKFIPSQKAKNVPHELLCDIFLKPACHDQEMAGGGKVEIQESSSIFIDAYHSMQAWFISVLVSLCWKLCVLWNNAATGNIKSFWNWGFLAKYRNSFGNVGVVIEASVCCFNCLPFEWDIMVKSWSVFIFINQTKLAETCELSFCTQTYLCISSFFRLQNKV